MRTINLTLTNQTLTLNSLESLPVQGSENSIKLKIAFDSSWEDYPTRKAYFQYFYSSWVYEDINEQGEVVVPTQVLAKGGFKVLVKGESQNGTYTSSIENIPVDFAPSLANSTKVIPTQIVSGDDAISVVQEGERVIISLNDEFESNTYFSEHIINGTASNKIISVTGVELGETDSDLDSFLKTYTQVAFEYRFTIGSNTYVGNIVADSTRYDDSHIYYVSDLIPLGENYTALVTLYLLEGKVKANISLVPIVLNLENDQVPTANSINIVNSGDLYTTLESLKATLKAYSDANLVVAKNYSDALLVESKQYTDTKYNSLVGIITHETEVMEARIAQAITQMQNQVNASITGMETTIQGELTALDTRVDEAISTMNTTISTSLTNMENTIQQELDNLDTRFSTLQTALEARITTLSNQIDSQFSTLQTQLEGRIDTLEGEVDDKLSEADEAIAILNGYNSRLTKVEGTYVTKIELYEALKRGEISSEVEKVYTSEINYITDNLMPSGKVTKILGKTEKSENVLVLNDVAENTRSGITYTLTNDIFKLNGEPVAKYSPVYNKTLSIDKGTYYLKSFGSITNGNYSARPRIRLYTSQSQYRDVFEGIVEYDDSITAIELLLQFDNLLGVSLSGTIAPMLVKGSTAPTEWSQGYEGLKHTHITGLKSTGINLFNERMVLGTLDITTGNVISISDRLVSEDFIEVLPNQDIYFRRGETATNMRLCYYDINHNFIKGEADGTPMNRAYTTPSLCHYIKFGLQSPYGTTYNHDICINKSDPTINGNYYPYEEDTLDIEADLNEYDYLDVEEKKKYVQTSVEKTIAGTNVISFGISSGTRVARAGLNINCSDYDNSVAWGSVIGVCSDSNISVIINNLDWIESNEIAFHTSTYGYTYISISGLTTQQEYVDYLNAHPIHLVYKLAEPIVTDVEVQDDGWLSNLIQGGSITQQIDTTDTTALIAKEVDIAVNVVVDNQ